MELQRINVKFFAADFRALTLETFIHVFNSWIQSADGVYYDVADYSHVPSGPGILLVAHEANISLDNACGRLGLLYNQKQFLSGSNLEKLRHVFRRALENCRKIEEEPLVKGKLRFSANEALIQINDRLIAPNTAETFQKIKSDIEALARQLYGGARFELERERDPRRRFGVGIKTAAPLTIEELLENIVKT